MVLNCSRRHQVYDEQRGHPIPGISHASSGVSDLQKAEKRKASFYVSGSNSHKHGTRHAYVVYIYNYIYIFNYVYYNYIYKIILYYIYMLKPADSFRMQVIVCFR